jgi:hypothetical protein
MVTLASLWLPILLAAVAVFIVSSLVHMVLTYHQTDVRAVPNEDEVMAALRPFQIPPGDYVLPRPATAQAMKSQEFQDKLKVGPVVFMTVLPNGPMAMGVQLGQWFVYCVVVGIFAGYLASRTVPPGTEYLQVFRITGTVAFAGYALALLQNSIWYMRNWVATFKSVVDGLLYSLVTAGFFGWLWPS